MSVTMLKTKVFVSLWIIILFQMACQVHSTPRKAASSPNQGVPPTDESRGKPPMSAKMATDTTRQLLRLRQLMSTGAKNLKAYLVPTNDAHQSEYISQHDARREYITGFTGSAGTAIITESQALLWTDGRYYLQAETQLDKNWQLMKESLPATLTREKWLVKNLPPRSNVGVNSYLISNSEWDTLNIALTKAGHTLVAVDKDLIDVVWNELDGAKRAAQPSNTIFTLQLNYTGKTSGEKVAEIREKMEEKNVDMLIVTALDEVAYLLNLRGSDIPYNPVFYAYVAILHSPAKMYVFANQTALQTECIDQLKAQGVEGLEIKDYTDMMKFIQEMVTMNVSTSLKADSVDPDYTVWISHGSSQATHIAATSTNQAGSSKRVEVVNEITPIALMKALKNDVESEGMKACHIRDGVALARYFSWLEHELVVKNNKDITEISGATELQRLRSELTDYMGLSFTTISASGPNGAIMHYSPKPDTNRALTTDDLYLCDSGAQFRDGTTDVTRTMHFGTPTAKQIEAFTLVLRGQIALGTAVFPTKIKGNVLDTLARRPLWQNGMDYAHGTGHGVGAYLNVHEGPMGISWRVMHNDPGLLPNMFLSNEPGYYENGEYGIRIEDIVRIITLAEPGDIPKNATLPRGLKGNFDGRGALAFETVTMCPIQRKMIDIKLMTDAEIDYLDDYHRTVWAKISPLLAEPHMKIALDWLKENTKPLRG